MSRVQLAVALAAALVAGLTAATILPGDKEPSDATRAAPSEVVPAPDVGEIRIAPGPAGPTTERGGVGVGYTHDSEGAVAAATNVVLTLEQIAQADRSDAVAAYEALAAQDAADQLSQQMGAVWDLVRDGVAANGPPGGRLFVRAVPVGHSVIRYSNERATVEVWSLTVVVGIGLARPVSSWETASIELVWEHDDWKVWSATTRPGPTPAWSADVATTPEEFLEAMAALEGYRYVANS